LKQFANIALILIALLFTVLVRQIVPESTFDPYILKLDTTWQKTDTEQEYIVDIANDSVPEKLVHHNINISGHSIELLQNGKLNSIYIFRDNETFIGSGLSFADINCDKLKELLFVTVKKDSAFLNILAYNLRKKLYFPIEKIKIDKISRYDNKPDVSNNFITTRDTDVYLDLQGGYSVQPRNIYKYNSDTKQLTKTKLNSIVCPRAQVFEAGTNRLLLAGYVKSTGNTISPQEAAGLRKSNNKDTLAMYEEVKHLEYEYGDFASYILLYNQQLEFAFKPIEFFGWTNYTKAGIINTEGKTVIVALTNAQKNEPENKKSKGITICNLKGKIIAQQPIDHNFTDLFTAQNRVFFFGNNTIYEYSTKLVQLNKVEDVTFASGFYDINRNQKPELIAFSNNVLKIMSVNLKALASFKIEQEYAPYPENNQIELLQTNNKSVFLYNTRLFYYMFSFSTNKYAWLKVPFLALVFAFWISLLIGMLKLNTRKLEKDKIRLEKVVAERTLQLEIKNKELDTQKNEIQAQAERLIVQNNHLEDLDKFKRLLIGTLVHDLKNPLGQILLVSRHKAVNSLAHKMLLLVTNLLDVDKYENTEFIVSKEYYSIISIINEVAENLEISLQDKNLTLSIQTPDIDVWADRSLLVRVFENILSNAIRFSPQNNTIHIAVQLLSDQTAGVSIKNCGASIPADSLHNIFEKYVQAKKSDSATFKSTGLGLYFCKMVLQAHGQTIKAENVTDGVVFSFTLPCRNNSEQKISTQTQSTLVILSASEKAMLQPWLNQLKMIEIYMGSDILEIVNQMPDASENTIALKQQISDAVFASNKELFLQLIS